MSDSKIPDCKFKIDQPVMSVIGRGVVKGVFREGGAWKVIVAYDESVVPAEVIPEPRGFSLFHCDEDLLKPIEE